MEITVKDMTIDNNGTHVTITKTTEEKLTEIDLLQRRQQYISQQSAIRMQMDRLASQFKEFGEMVKNCDDILATFNKELPSLE